MYENKFSCRLRPPTIKIPTLYTKINEESLGNIDACSTSNDYENYNDYNCNELSLVENEWVNCTSRFSNKAFTTRNRSNTGTVKEKVNTCKISNGDIDGCNKKKELEVVECTPWQASLNSEFSENSIYCNSEENRQCRENLEKQSLSVWESAFSDNDAVTNIRKNNNAVDDAAAAASDMNCESNKFMNKADCNEWHIDAKFVGNEVEDNIVKQFRERCNQQTLPATMQTFNSAANIIVEKPEVAKERISESPYQPLQTPLLHEHSCKTFLELPERSRSPPPRTLRSECKPFICSTMHSIKTHNSCVNTDDDSNINNAISNSANLELEDEMQNTEIIPRSRSPSPQPISATHNELCKDAKSTPTIVIKELCPPFESSTSTSEVYKNKRSTKSQSGTSFLRNHNMKGKEEEAHVLHEHHSSFTKTPSELQNTCDAIKQHQKISRSRSSSSNLISNRPRWNQHIPRKLTNEHLPKKSCAADSLNTTRSRVWSMLTNKSGNCSQDGCKERKTLVKKRVFREDATDATVQSHNNKDNNILSTVQRRSNLKERLSVTSIPTVATVNAAINKSKSKTMYNLNTSIKSNYDYNQCNKNNIIDNTKEEKNNNVTRSVNWQRSLEMSRTNEKSSELEASSDLSLVERENDNNSSSEKEYKLNLIERQLFSDSENAEHSLIQNKPMEQSQQCQDKKECEYYSQPLTTHSLTSVQMPHLTKMQHEIIQWNREQRKLEESQWELFVQEEQLKHLEYLCRRIKKMLCDVMKDCTMTQDDAQERQSVIQEHMQHMVECVKLIVMQRASYNSNYHKVNELRTVSDTFQLEWSGKDTLCNAKVKQAVYHDKESTYKERCEECNDADSCIYSSSTDNDITPSPIASEAKSSNYEFNHKSNNNLFPNNTSNTTEWVSMKNGQLIASTPLRQPPSLPINLHMRASCNEQQSRLQLLLLS